MLKALAIAALLGNTSAGSACDGLLDRFHND